MVMGEVENSTRNKDPAKGKRKAIKVSWETDGFRS